VAKILVKAKDRKTAMDAGQEAMYKAAFLNIANAFCHIDLKWIKKNMGNMHIVLGLDTIPLEMYQTCKNVLFFFQKHQLSS